MNPENGQGDRYVFESGKACGRSQIDVCGARSAARELSVENCGNVEF